MSGYDCEFIWSKMLDRLSEVGHVRVFYDQMALARLVRSQMGISDSEAGKPVQRLDRDSRWMEVDYAIKIVAENAQGAISRVAIADRHWPTLWHIVEWRDDEFVIRGQYHTEQSTPEKIILEPNTVAMYSRGDGGVFYKNVQSDNSYAGWFEPIIGEGHREIENWIPSRN